MRNDLNMTGDYTKVQHLVPSNDFCREESQWLYNRCLLGHKGGRELLFARYGSCAVSLPTAPKTASAVRSRSVLPIIHGLTGFKRWQVDAQDCARGQILAEAPAHPERRS